MYYVVSFILIRFVSSRIYVSVLLCSMMMMMMLIHSASMRFVLKLNEDKSNHSCKPGNHLCACIKDIQGIHKRMVRFQKLTRNLFLALHRHNVHCQQRQLSKFLLRYQQFTSHAYCRAAGPVSKMASQQEKALCVLRFEVSGSVITVQCKFCAQFRKDAWCVFSKLCTKLMLQCNHRSGHLKREHAESLFLL